MLSSNGGDVTHPSSAPSGSAPTWPGLSPYPAILFSCTALNFSNEDPPPCARYVSYILRRSMFLPFCSGLVAPWGGEVSAASRAPAGRAPIWPGVVPYWFAFFNPIEGSPPAVISFALSRPASARSSTHGGEVKTP